MAKTVLVPTDFSIASLNMVRHALEKNPKDPLHVIFVAGVHVRDSIMSMLFFSRTKVVDELTTDEFREACQIIRNRYTTEIQSMRTEIFTGFTQNAFQNFIEGHQIDELYLPQSSLSYTKNTFDLVPFIKKSKLPQFSVAWNADRGTHVTGSLAQLFTHWN